MRAMVLVLAMVFSACSVTEEGDLSVSLDVSGPDAEASLKVYMPDDWDDFESDFNMVVQSLGGMSDDFHWKLDEDYWWVTVSLYCGKINQIDYFNIPDGYILTDMDGNPPAESIDLTDREAEEDSILILFDGLPDLKLSRP